MKTATNESPARLTFPILLTLTGIICLAVIQALGGNCAVPIATASAMLVFCARRPSFTTWELLHQLYFMRTSSPKC